MREIASQWANDAFFNLETCPVMHPFGMSRSFAAFLASVSLETGGRSIEVKV
jgi:hypothetical protein